MKMMLRWSLAEILMAMDRLDRFIGLSDLDDELVGLEKAMDRLKVDGRIRLEYLVTREVARWFMKNGKRPSEVKGVVVRRAENKLGFKIEVSLAASCKEAALR